MSIALGAILSAAAGGITGAIVASLRRTRLSPGWRSVFPLLGGLIAVLAFGVCMALGTAVGMLTWSSAPDPGPAVVFVVVASVGLAIAILGSLGGSSP